MKSTKFVRVLSFVLSFLLILNFPFDNINITAYAAGDDFIPVTILIDSDTTIDSSNVSAFNGDDIQIRISQGVILNVSDEASVNINAIIAEQNAKVINSGIINAESVELISNNQFTSSGQIGVNEFTCDDSIVYLSGSNSIASLKMNNGGMCNISGGTTSISELFANNEAKIQVIDEGKLNLGDSSSSADNIFNSIIVDSGKLVLDENFKATGNRLLQNGGEVTVNSSSLHTDMTVEGLSSEATTDIFGNLYGTLTVKSNSWVNVYGQTDKIEVYNLVDTNINEYAVVNEINVYETGEIYPYDYILIPKNATINNYTAGDSFNVQLGTYYMVFTLEPSSSYYFASDIKDNLMTATANLGTLYTQEESFGKFTISNPFPAEVYAQFYPDKLYPFVFPEEELTAKYYDSGLGIYGYDPDERVYYIKLDANSDKEIKVSAASYFNEYGEVSVSNESSDLVDLFIEDKVFHDNEFIPFKPDEKTPNYTLSGKVLEKEVIPDDPADDPTEDPDEPDEDPDEPDEDPDEPNEDPDEPNEDPDEPDEDPEEPDENPEDKPTKNPEDNPQVNPDDDNNKTATDSPSDENKVAKKQGKATVTVADVYYGLKPSVTVTSETNDVSKASIRYKSGNEYLENIPEKVGNYTVEVILPGNDEYEEVRVTSSFSIEFLPAPTEMCSITGDEGESGYYRSAVTLTPPKGYKASLSLDGLYQDSLIFNSGVNLDGIYLIDGFGRKTDIIRLDKKIVIDKTNPSINGFKNNDTVYSDKLTVEIYDENLSKVVVNGKEQTINGSKFTVELTGDAQGKDITYIIEAYDRSGGCVSQTVVLKEAWRAGNLIPIGKTVWVFKGEKYHLPQGTWKIEGDSCIYSGDIEVFVASDKQISLSQ